MNKIIGIIGVVLFFWFSWAQAGELPVGCIKTVMGSAVIVRLNQPLPAKIGEKIFKNDSFKTGPDGSLGMILKDDTLLSLGPNTEVTINEFFFSPAEGKLSIVTRLFKGTVAYLSGIIAKLSPDSVRFETPVGNVGIRGTKFAVKIEESDPDSQKISTTPSELRADSRVRSPLGIREKVSHEPI
jgi:FecR protein